MTEQASPGDRVVNGRYRALPDAVQEDVLTLVLNLAAEVWTLRDKVRLLQMALEAQGSAVGATVEQRRNEPDQLTAMRADRDAYVGRLFRGVAEIPAERINSEG